MSYAHGMYMPRIPEWIVTNDVGCCSATSALKIWVSGSEKGCGPGFVSAGENSGEGSHFSSQFLFKSTPFSLIRKQKSPSSTLRRLCGLPFKTTRNSVSSSTPLRYSDVSVSPHKDFKKYKPDSGEMSSRACSPNKKYILFFGVAPSFFMLAIAIVTPPASFESTVSPGHDVERR